MKLAYIVLAYTLPQQVARMIRALDHEEARFLVHVDRKASRSLHKALHSELDGHPRVRFIRQYDCHWGGFGIVAALLEGIRVLVEEERDYSYGLAVSNQDYPVKPVAAIHDFFARAGGRSFLDADQLPSRRFGGRGGLDRLERMHWARTVRGHRLYVPNRYLPLSPWRAFIPGLVPYGGSGYWALSRDCLDLVHDTVRRRPELERFFKWVSIPDESFFQTIVMNSELRETVVRRNVHYVDWSEGRPSPKILTVEDLKNLRMTPKLLARKFDVSVDTEVLDRIDSELREEVK